MRWRPTEFEDFERITMPYDPSDMDVRQILEDTEECRRGLALNARTWEFDEEVIAIIGVTPMWKGVGSVWTFLSEASLKRGIALTRAVRRELEMLHVDRGYWRIQATVEDMNEEARLWILALGFTYEGTMAAYGMDAETHHLYARVRFY